MKPSDSDTPDAVSPIITPALLGKYEKPGPRYTSYPTAAEWSAAFGPGEYRAALGRAAEHPESPLSAYIHLPFCWERCLFCGCNVVVSKHPEVADKYLSYVERELTLTADLLGPRRTVTQIHWGGGTPTYLSVDQMRNLHGMVQRAFEIAPGAELALEIDARSTTYEQLEALRALGFNRISIGVQDFDPEVQRVINRNQGETETREVFDWCRALGFSGINLDLIYGLPGQTADGWRKTMDAIIAMRPDRLAVYGYAHLPGRLKHQRRLEGLDRPEGVQKYELFALARSLLLDAGYRAIGMDHFALPDDELSVALDEGRLNRNFMGYTVCPATELAGFGVSAISDMGDCYAQNEKRLVTYYRALDAGIPPTALGISLTPEDKVRRWIIRELMCNLHLDCSVLKRRFGIDYDDYFAREEADLGHYYADGLLERTPDGDIAVLPLGRPFIRTICMVFDAYSRASRNEKVFSRTV